MYASSLFLSLIIAGQSTPSPALQATADTKERIEVWGQALQRALAKDPRPIMVDVDLAQSPPELKNPIRGVSEETIYAACLGRNYVQSGTAVGFCRPPTAMYAVESGLNRRVLDAILSLDPSTIKGTWKRSIATGSTYKDPSCLCSNCV